jgi:hypothetical protein
MKKTILVAALLALSFCAFAQTNQVPNLITNASPDILADLQSGLGDLTSGTNWSAAVGGGLSTDGKNSIVYGVICYSFTKNVGVIAGYDYLMNKAGNQSSSLKGGITLSTQIMPLSWTGVSFLQSIKGTPFVADLVASGKGGQSIGNIVATGIDFDLYAIKNFELSAGAEYDNRTGQGIYSGNYITGHIALSRTF